MMGVPFYVGKVSDVILNYFAKYDIIMIIVQEE